MRQRELASRLRLEKSTVSRLVRKMEANRWIQRTCDRQDGRAVLIRLTRQGREAATQIARARQEKFARILSAIPPDKQSLVVEAVSILERATCQSEGPQERLRGPLLSSGPLRSEASGSASSIPPSQHACSLKSRRHEVFGGIAWFGAQPETQQSHVFCAWLLRHPRPCQAAIRKSEDFLSLLYAAQMLESE